MKKKKVIYTVITSDYDYLRTPRYINEDYDYICFTNNKKLKSKVWKIRKIPKLDGLDDIRMQRYIKICPHIFLPNYEMSVYVDANIRIIGNIDIYINNFLGESSMLCVPHPDRDCIYKEAKECIDLGKGSEEQINAQVQSYEIEGYPRQNGLVVTSVLVRRHMEDQLLIKTMNDWWHEVKNKSYRDQLSFNYVCWKNEFKYELSNVHVYKNDYWVCPGIHTKDIEVVEDNLIDSMLLAAYRGYYIQQLEKKIKDLENIKNDKDDSR